MLHGMLCEITYTFDAKWCAKRFVLSSICTTCHMVCDFFVYTVRYRLLYGIHKKYVPQVMSHPMCNMYAKKNTRCTKPRVEWLWGFRCALFNVLVGFIGRFLCCQLIHIKCWFGINDVAIRCVPHKVEGIARCHR